MTHVGLRHVPVLEDVIGSGVTIQPKKRPWTQLSDDPRVLAYSNMDPSVYRDLGMKFAAARRFQDEVRDYKCRDSDGCEPVPGATMDSLPRMSRRTTRTVTPTTRVRPRRAQGRMRATLMRPT